MKRLKHIWMTILTVVLAISVMIGGAALPALAEAGGTSSPIPVTTTNVIGSAVTIPSKVKLGGKVKVDGVTSVQAPNGSVFTPTGAEFTADMLGNYVVTYKSGNNSYTKNVNCYLDDVFDFRVAHDGAKIPTYTDIITEHPFPTAELYIYDNEKGEYKEHKGGYSYQILVDGEPVDKTKAHVYGIPGTHTVQYVATLTGTKKNFTKEYTVKSQSLFDDGSTIASRPSLSISGIPLEASINTKVTLPKATTSDNFDANVFVDIKVTYKGDKVKQVEVDDNGYATKTLEEDVIFDNVHNLSFYPTVAGTYRVEYRAYDDSSTNNASVPHIQEIKVLDKTAPKLVEIADDKIPSRWGIDVYKKGETTSTSKTINFPFPVYADNSDENLKVSFEIRDTTNNNTVIKFANIYDFTKKADGSVDELKEGTKYKFLPDAPANGLYEGEATFDPETGFNFNLANYNLNDTDLVKTGTYTAIYQARDGKPNITSKSYDITVESVLKDEAAPDVAPIEDTYLYVESFATDDEFQEYTLPFATVTDNADSRPTIEYTVTLDNNGVDSSFLVENGATIKINSTKVQYEGKTYNYNGDTLEISVVGRDNVGNESKPTKTVITLVKESSFKNDTNVKLDISALTNTGSNKDANTLVTLGDLEINSFNSAFRAYNGFEIALTYENGDVVSGLSLETFVSKNTTDNAKQSIFIKNIAFTPSYGGDYTLTVRAFDISGRSIVKDFAVTIAGTSSSGNKIQSSTIQNKGDINVSYKLKNETANNINHADGKDYISRKISNAGKFSLMGIEFTAMSAGKYTFLDGYYIDTTGLKEGDDGFRPLSSTYNFSAEENSNTVFELLGTMPTKAERSSTAYIKLAEVIAFNEYSNAIIEISIKSPSLRTLNMETEIQKIEFDNGAVRYEFIGAEHGVYTVTYTASINGSNEVKQTYSIKVGDVMPPIFQLVSKHAPSAYVDFEFKFKKIDVKHFTENNSDLITETTFTKNLIDPSGTVVYTVSGKNETYANAEIKLSDDAGYKLTKSGYYTVEYKTIDKHNNESVIKETINVTASGSVSKTPLKVLRTVLIIVGIILIAGVVFYLVRYRKERNLGKKSA